MSLDSVGLLAKPVVSGEAKGSGPASERSVSERSTHPVQDVAAKDATVDPMEAVRAAARHIESFLKSMGRSLEFRVDADTGRTVVTVRDTASGDVIRQIPGDEVLHLARHLQARTAALIDTEA